MLSVRDGDVAWPFSEPLLARTLVATGLAPPDAMQVAASVHQVLGGGHPRTVDIRDVREATIGTLRDRNSAAAARRLRVRWWLHDERQPVVLAVGGTSGVGKSTISEAAARILGIDQVLSTDLVRAVLRVTLHPELLPTLSASSFSARRMLRSNIAGDELLRAFEQQATVVGHATAALSRRALKEGMQLVLNGVHVVPGLIAVDDDWPLFGYMLSVPDLAEHERRFQARFAETGRDSAEALDRILAIRQLDAYLVAHSQAAGVPVIPSRDLATTTSDLVDAITTDLERRFDLS